MEKEGIKVLESSDILNFGWFTKVYNAIDMWYGSKRKEFAFNGNVYDNIRVFCANCDRMFSDMRNCKTSSQLFSIKCCLISSFLFTLSYIDRATLGFNLYATYTSHKKIKQDIEQYVKRVASMHYRRCYDIGTCNSIKGVEDDLYMCSIFAKSKFQVKLKSDNMAAPRWNLSYRYSVDTIRLIEDKKSKQLIAVPSQIMVQENYTSGFSFFDSLRRLAYDIVTFKREMDSLDDKSVKPLEYIEHLMQNGYNVVSLSECNGYLEALILGKYNLESDKGARKMVRVSNTYVDFLRNHDNEKYSKSNFHKLDKINRILLRKDNS